MSNVYSNWNWFGLHAEDASNKTFSHKKYLFHGGPVFFFFISVISINDMYCSKLIDSFSKIVIDPKNVPLKSSKTG